MSAFDLEITEAMWTKNDLQKLIKEKLGDYLFIVVSNRQPYAHIFNKGKVECQRGAGGVVTALDPILQACKGTWIAFGSGNADRFTSDKQGKVEVPPENPTYTLKRVWLTKEEENDAVMINPFDKENFSEGIFTALNLSDEEKKKRMVKMREVVKNNNIYRWAGKILSELLKLEFKE